MNEGQIFIEGEITPQTTLEVKDVLNRNANCDSFCIHISSPGGSVYDGYKIFHAIRNAATLNGSKKAVRAVIEGEAQSMATIISMAADKGQIEIANPSRYMIHNPSMGVKGTAEDFTQGANELVMIQDEMSQIYSQRTGIPIEQIKEMMKVTTTMSAAEAVRLGFADKFSANLRAVALGTTMNESEEIKTLGQKIDNLIAKVTKTPKAVTGPAKAAPAPAPTQAAPMPPAAPVPPKSMIDAPLTDGTVLSIDAPSEDMLVGAAAMLNGAPAPDGQYSCIDGDIITVAGGVVTAVQTEMDSLALENQALKAQLEALKPAVATLAEQAAVIEEVKTTAKALNEQINELKSKTVGNPDKPNEGLAVSRQPVGQGPSAVAKQTTDFLGEYMPWLEQYNTKRGNSPVLANKVGL